MPFPSNYVPEHELGPRHTACPFCHDDSHRISEVRLQSGPDVWMRRCSVCHASVADRFPRNEFLDKLYDPSFYSSPVSAERSITNKCARRLLAYFQPPPNQPLELLDYGGNQGGLVRAVRQQLLESGHRGPIRGTVVDLYPSSDDEGLRFLSPAQFAEEPLRYDLVIASAVLEHLTKLRTTIEKLLDVCLPGALFYARTPYEVPLARLPFGYPIRWPRHLYDLGPQFWGNVLGTLDRDGRVIESRPSFVESSFARFPIRTLVAQVLKAPAQFENQYLLERLNYATPKWRWVGGWEALLVPNNGHLGLT